MQLNFKHLRYFRAVAHIGNLTRAAAQLNLSQSALSVQIRKLEAQLGHALFDRKGRQLHLTEAGRIALDYADAIFSTSEELLGTMAGARASRPVLRIGAMATLSRNFQIGLLRPLLGRTDAGLVLRSGSPDVLLADLEALALDAVLLNAAPGPDRAGMFRSFRLAEQQVSLVGTPARLQRIGALAETLSAHPVVLPSSYGSIRTGFEALAERLGIRPRIAAEADDMAMLRLLAREDVGIAVLPPVVVRDELQSGQLIEAHLLPGVFESFYAVTVERRFPNPLLKTVLDAARANVEIA